jgi:hypothetical protein
LLLVQVVDEADKAPLHVTSILKTLVESGEMMLSDGRRIVSKPDMFVNDNIIKMHPDFRMIVLVLVLSNFLTDDESTQCVSPR